MIGVELTKLTSDRWDKALSDDEFIPDSERINSSKALSHNAKDLNLRRSA